MSSLINSLALLIAIVGLAAASYAGLVNAEWGVEDLVHIPGSLSELGDFDTLDWAKTLRSECKAHDCEPDKAFELLKKLDAIYGALGENSRYHRKEHLIVEQFQINQIDGEEFCTRQNSDQLLALDTCYRSIFKPDMNVRYDGYVESVADYLRERWNNFAFVCRSRVLKDLNKRVADLNETDRHDMEQSLGNKLVSQKDSYERVAKPYAKPTVFSREWMDILLEFLKEKSGNDLDAKDYITKGDEGKRKFRELFKESVLNLCSRWRDATDEAESFAKRDGRQRDDYTEEQANWMNYAHACYKITFHDTFLAESLYLKYKSQSSKVPTLKGAIKKGLKKMSHSGARSQ